MTSLTGALAGTFTADQILKFISKVYPELGGRIRTARSLGRTAEDILGYISKMDKGHFSSAKRTKEANPYLQAQELTQKVHPIGKILMGTAAAGLGAYGLARGLPAIARSSVGQNILSGLGLSSSASAPQPETTLSPSTQALEPSSIATQSQQPTPLQTQSLPEQQNLPPQQPPSIDSASILAELGLDQKTNNLLAQGKLPEIVSREVIGSLNPKQKKLFTEKVQKGQIPPTLDAIIKDYAAKTPRQTLQNAPGSAIAAQPKSEIENRAIIAPQVEESRHALSKGNLVSTPSGIATLESIRQKQALVKDDQGKLHKVDADKLVASPLPEKDLADLHEELIRAIETETGEDVSRMVNWAGYNPRTNKLSFLPHIGAMYTYGNISPEDVELLTSILNTRKTSGENFIGAWKAGSKSPIGAAMSKLIQKLQAERGGKGSEYEEKFETIYDAVEPAKKAAREKKKRRKNERG